MGITNSNKVLSTDRISCGETFKVTLSLTAEPSIVSNPVDVVLILDRSRSMLGTPLDNLKKGALKFIDILDESTDGSHDGQIGGGSRIGIVSFATTATQDTQLITSVHDLNEAVEALEANGRTNHEDAFTKALELFDPASTNEKILVMFTDGVTTEGGDPTPITTAAKADGVIIYVIGLSGNGGIDEQALKDWASDPDSAYVAITPDDEKLEELFEDLAQNISKPGAKNIVITDEVDDCFRIVSVNTPNKGTASLLDSQTVQWKIAELGVKESEGASLEFTVEHVGPCSGTIEVNSHISYDDDDHNVVRFPSPEITVDCGTIICPEGCPEPVDVTIGGCDDVVEYNAGEIGLDSPGRILELDATIKDVCPGRRVALAVILNEVDDEYNEHKRGLMTITVPAHDKDGCRDVTVRCIRFVLPEDLDVSGDPDAICNERKFKARFIAHYIDNDFECCCDDAAAPAKG